MQIATLLNAAGLFTGLVGSALIFKFGLPSLSVLSEANYTAMDPQVPRVRRYARLSRIGLGLLVAAFALQLAALLLS